MGFRGRENGPQGSSVESVKVLGDTSFRIRGAKTVEAQVFYGDPKKPNSFSISLSLAETTSIAGQDLGNGMVRGVLDSDIRKRVVLGKRKDEKEVNEENSALAQDLVRKQRELQVRLDEEKIGSGSLVRIEITAPTSFLLV